MEEPSKKLVVVIPAYNKERTIQNAINALKEIRPDVEQVGSKFLI